MTGGGQTAIRTSAIIVSRRRPQELLRCIQALRLQTHTDFEVIVVADGPSLARVADSFRGMVKTVENDRPNISHARNLGLQQSAAPVVAFLDDDCIPEPTWLCRLTEPFRDASVVAAGGYVRGWTGTRLSFAGKTIDGLATERPLGLSGDATRIISPPPDGAIVTIGTNCAFRREALERIGGFDTGLAFHLDEADANMRLARTRGRTAIVPLAEVMHLQAESERRTDDRMPRTLFDIGRSTALFLRRHAQAEDLRTAIDLVRQAERRRLVGFMVAGRILPTDIPPLLATFNDGVSSGLAADMPPPALKPGRAPRFLVFPAGAAKGGELLVGRSWHRRKLRGIAARLVEEGACVTVVLYYPGFLGRRVRMHPGGWWEETAGLLSAPVPAGWTTGRILAARAAADRQRIARVRPVDRTRIAPIAEGIR